MGQFIAYDFEFDGIPSQRFDLKIITFDDGSLFDGVGSNSVEIISQSVLRKSVPYYLGRTQPTVLEFDLTFGTARPISGMERDIISAWLFGRAGYKNLTIMQDDLNGAYFKCFMQDPVPQYIGGLNYAFKCTVICDSPWAYSPQHRFFQTITGITGQYSYEFDIYNNSSEDEYLYPEIRCYFSHANAGNKEYLELYNITDQNRLSTFGQRTTILGMFLTGDELFVNNDLQIVSGIRGTTGEAITGILTNCNKNWFRLLPGLNSIGVDINILNDTIDFQLTWTDRLKIGG
jgi:hypothetical protein